MEKAALLQITDIETLKLKYQEILGERVHSDGTHPLYNKGVFDGMAILLSALSESMQKRKQIVGPTTV
jgi:hypothetical protein